MTLLWCYLTGVGCTLFTATMSDYADAPRDGKPVSQATKLGKNVVLALLWHVVYPLWGIAVLVHEIHACITPEAHEEDWKK
jgi:hypothetical protein